MHGLAIATLALLAMAGCHRGVDPESNNVEVDGGYDVTLRWTPYGIPHVTAKDWGSLGFGVAYVAATDSLCTLAREFLTVRGEQAKFLGPDEGRRDSDVFHRAMLTPDVLAGVRRGQPPALQALTAGYVAGYNRYLKDHPPEARPTDCRDQAWVKPIDLDDAARIAVAVATRHDLGRAQAAVLAATPPAALVPPATPAAAAAAALAPAYAAARAVAGVAAPGMPDDEASSLGSNAIAFGREATANQRGLLFANPHFPWAGAARFHVMHLTIPGQLDSMGAGLLTSMLVNIGFNRDVAWTHTVSSAQRATLFALDLVPGRPTSYRWGGAVRALERRSVTVDVLGRDGKVGKHTQDVWMSHLGPVVVDAELPWTPARAYVLRDANLGNNRSALTYLKLNTARSVADVLTALQVGQGTPWVNTVAADRAGNTLYADIGRLPNIDYPHLVRCGLPTLTQWRERRVIALRGAPDCDWPNDPTAAAPGLMGPARMPALQRTDYVMNSNDSHWLAHARQRLEGFSPVLGEEGTVRSLRTRAGHALIANWLSDGQRVTAAQLQAMVAEQRNVWGTRLLPDVLATCTRAQGKVELANGNPADVTRACAVLKRWDGTARAGSVGAVLWAEFWPRAAKVENVWRTPFRIDDPLATPSGVNIESEPVREGVLRALVEAQDALAAAGIALDATLGSVQYVTDGDKRVPIPGGPGQAGAFSVIDARLDGGRAAIRAGNSWLQVVGWNAGGKVQASGVLTYSQSDDPASPHHADMTRMYSDGKWLELPFTEAAIEAAGVEDELHLMDARE